jgi:hypothetical protein
MNLKYLNDDKIKIKEVIFDLCIANLGRELPQACTMKQACS